MKYPRYRILRDRQFEATRYRLPFRPPPASVDAAATTAKQNEPAKPAKPANSEE